MLHVGWGCNNGERELCALNGCVVYTHVLHVCRHMCVCVCVCTQNLVVRLQRNNGKPRAHFHHSVRPTGCPDTGAHVVCECVCFVCGMSFVTAWPFCRANWIRFAQRTGGIVLSITIPLSLTPIPPGGARCTFGITITFNSPPLNGHEYA